MITRRNFIKLNGITTAGIGMGLKPDWFEAPYKDSKRVKPELRRFNSAAVEDKIAKVKADIADPELPHDGFAPLFPRA